MIRRHLLAATALLLLPAAGFAQFGGMGNQPDGNAAGQGMGMMGGMGGMGGGMGGFPGNFPRRTVQVQFQGGKKVAGKLQLGHVAVAGELGQYMIRPEFVKIIRFAPKAKEKGEDAEDENHQAEHEAVVTTLGEEIRGQVQRQNWVLEIDCGTLTLDPESLRSMTFLPQTDPKTSAAAHPSGSNPAPLKVTTIEGPNAVALMVTGPKITRLAAATEMSGDWIPIDLREPVEGRAVPILAPGIVVYGLGRHVYAFSSETRRWDILDLPEGVKAAPVVGPGSARVQVGGHIHEFNAKTGKWKDIDTQAILDGVQEKALKALQQPAPRP